MSEGVRWFGPNDSVTLAELRQTGASVVYSGLHDIAAGEAWSREAITARQREIGAQGLRWAVVESVPVSEAIKTRTGDFERHLANYATTVQRIGAAGIEVVVYNFMPVLDWVRTDLHFRLPDGAEALRYDPVAFAAFDLHVVRGDAATSDWPASTRDEADRFWQDLGPAARAAFTRQTLDLFPGVRLGLTVEGLRERLASYAAIDAARLRENLRLFLQAVVPAAEEAGVRLAIHPDDPPYPLLGLPRVVSTEADLRAVVALVDRPANGLCLCTGSLGVRADNDLTGIAERLGERVHAVHLRSVKREPSGAFHEAAHLAGDVDMPGVVAALLREMQRRRDAGRPDAAISFRPDHAHRILDDFRRPAPACPGYPLIGRLRGLAELRGLQRGLAASAVLPKQS